MEDPSIPVAADSGVVTEIRLDGVVVGVSWRDDRLRLEVNDATVILPWTPSLLTRANAWLRWQGVRSPSSIVEERLRSAIEAQTIARDPDAAPILRRVATREACLLLCTSILRSRPHFTEALRISPAAVFVARQLNRECRSVSMARRRLRRWQNAFRDRSGAGLDAAIVDRWSTVPTVLWHLRAIRTTVVPRSLASLSLVARMVETVGRILGDDPAGHPQRERPAVQFFGLARVRRVVDALLRLDDAAVAALGRPILMTLVPREAILFEHLLARAIVVGICGTGSDAVCTILAFGLDLVLREAREQRVGTVADLSQDGEVADGIRRSCAALTWPSARAARPRGRPAPRPLPPRKTQAIVSLWRLHQASPSTQAVRSVLRDRPALRVMARRRFWELRLDRHLERRAFRVALSWCAGRPNGTAEAVVDLLVDWERLWSADQRTTPALQATLAHLDLHLTARHLRCFQRVRLTRAIPSLSHLHIVATLSELNNPDERDAAIARVCGLTGAELSAVTALVEPLLVRFAYHETEEGIWHWVIKRLPMTSVDAGRDWLAGVRAAIKDLTDAEAILSLQRSLGRPGLEIDATLSLPPLPAPPPAGTRVVRTVRELYDLTRGDRSQMRKFAMAVIDGRAWLVLKELPRTASRHSGVEERPSRVLVARGGHILWSSPRCDGDLRTTAAAWAATHGKWESDPDPPAWIGLHPGLLGDFDGPRIGGILMQHRAHELEYTRRMSAATPHLLRSGTMSSHAEALARSLTTMTKRESVAAIVVVVEAGQWSMETINRGRSGLLLAGSAVLASPRVRSRHAAPVDLIVRHSTRSGEVEAVWLGGPWPGPLQAVFPTRLAPDVLYGAELPGRHVFVYAPSRFPSVQRQRVSAMWGPLPTSPSAPTAVRTTPRVIRSGDRIAIAPDALVVIGGDPRHVDVIVDAPSVSPQHLLLWPRVMGWQAVDLATPWGTRIVRRLAIDTGPPSVSIGSPHWRLPGLAPSRAVSVGGRLVFGGGVTLEIDINPPR